MRLQTLVESVAKYIEAFLANIAVKFRISIQAYLDSHCIKWPTGLLCRAEDVSSTPRVKLKSGKDYLANM